MVASKIHRIRYKQVISLSKYPSASRLNVAARRLASFAAIGIPDGTDDPAPNKSTVFSGSMLSINLATSRGIYKPYPTKNDIETFPPCCNARKYTKLLRI